MKKILGLDLGTNSIGWALIEIDHKKGIVKILGLGSRILPMDAGEIKDFESKGKIKSTAAQRTEKRGQRRLNERYLLRRDRLHLVLNLLDALPKHYKLEIDFTNRNGEKCGQFKDNKEPKLVYLPKQQEKKAEFIFLFSYLEMLNDIGVKNEKDKRIPYDWTLYYLRQKALQKKISLEELAWVLLSYNQKRGYEKMEVLDKSTKEGEIIEDLDLIVKKVSERRQDNEGRNYFEVYLEGNDAFVYKEYVDKQMTFASDLKEVIKTSKVDEQGNIDNSKTVFTVVDIYSLEIKEVNYEKEDGKHKYTLTFHNGWQEIKQPKNYIFRYKNTLNKSFDYIVETIYDSQGNIKNVQGKERKLREPDLSGTSNDWTLLKKKTEKEALAFNIDKGYINEKTCEPRKYISTQIYDILKNNAKSGNRTKIIGGRFQVVDRDFYREELSQIITTQKEHHTSLEDKNVFEQCVKTLYPKNKNHQESLLKNKDAIQHLLVEDILLFQRPLKSKKSEIANCKYEIRYWKDVVDKNGNPIEEVDIGTGEVKTNKEPVYRKVVSASHPYFQEFRIWDKLHNLRLIQLERLNKETGKVQTNQDVTKEYYKTETDYQNLFNKLNNQKSLSQEQFLKYCKDTFGIPYNKKKKDFVWNFPEDEELKRNETRVSFVTRFERCGFTDYTEFLTKEKELDLWHYLYSVSYKERKANKNKSATTFFNRFLEGSNVKTEVKEKIIKDFVNYPKFASKYCAYSEKALKKLLSFIRLSENKETDNWVNEKWFIKWKEMLLVREKEILQRIKKIDFNAEEINYSEVINTSVDLQKGELSFPKGLFNTFKGFEQIKDFKHLNLTQVSYLVYGRHSELAQAKYWISPDDIRKKLHLELKQHSLNNPVAEKVLFEMMQIVAKIWEHYGENEKGTENYKKLFDEIHLEVGRDLKKSAKEKDKESKRQSSNKSQNKRIRQVLVEFLENSTYNANPKNTDHFERLKIVEEGAEHRKNTDKKFFDDKQYSKKDIEDILKKPSISKSDFDKYKLWIEQGYKSPYTDRIIKITDLFDGNKYNIDHIFPQASITNNSLSNKIVCETEINKLKSNQTGREFVNNPKERKRYCVAHGKEVTIVDDTTYVSTVKAQFSGTKRYILLSKEIPKGFTNSQLNNTRHIARKAMELLSHIVREPGEVEFRSKNVLPVTGRITSELKKAWKLNEVWSELMRPRYIRLNELTKSKLFGNWQKSKSGHDYFDCNLDDIIREKDEAYNIKRIDHRHHALDALIVALCTEDHVNYINNINANAKSNNYGKQKQIEKYRQTLKRKIKFSKKEKEQDNNNWHYILPGGKRQQDAENSHENSVLTKSYFYKNFDSFNSDYKKMILVALQHTVITFKQNLRVINKTVNRYNNTPDKNKFIKQKAKEAGNKTNWAIRRSLSEDTFYGKVYLGETENKQLHKSLSILYTSPKIIVDKELQVRILKIKQNSSSYLEFKKKVKAEFTNKKVELKVYKIAVRKHLDKKFNRDKIKTITDTGIQKILFNHLKESDTIELPFDEAIGYFNALLEKEELEAIPKNEDNDFNNTAELIEHLKGNKYKFDKTDYSKLNVFINQISDRDFRNEESFKSKIQEHPEIAFSFEEIEEMNMSKNLKKLNNGKNHAPIKKVRISRGFGKQRSLSEDILSVKSKQYVVNDGDSNLYLGFYERTYTDADGNEVLERKFQDIGLIDLIETLKQDKSKRLNPLPDKIYDDQLNEFTRIFILSPRDLVYVPTEEEIENSSLVNFDNLTKEQVGRIYKYVDGGKNSSGKGYYANFIPYSVSVPIWRFYGEKNKEIFKELSKNNKINITDKKLIQDEFGLGSPRNKNQNMIDGKAQIKKICWKLKVDRLGIIVDIVR